MSAPGKAKDACASRAKPRLEERVCERGRRPTRNACAKVRLATRAHRRARRRASPQEADARPLIKHKRYKEAEG